MLAPPNWFDSPRTIVPTLQNRGSSIFGTTELWPESSPAFNLFSRCRKPPAGRP